MDLSWVTSHLSTEIEVRSSSIVEAYHIGGAKGYRIGSFFPERFRVEKTEDWTFFENMEETVVPLSGKHMCFFVA